MMRLTLFSILLLVSIFTTQAGELVYKPVNPAFGGNSINGTWLLNNAQAQNDTTDPDEDRTDEKSALDRFNDTMERLVLSRLSTAIVDQFTVMDADGIYTLVAGSYTVGDFQVDIVETDGLTTITTTDTTSGQTTYFVIENE